MVHSTLCPPLEVLHKQEARQGCCKQGCSHSFSVSQGTTAMQKERAHTAPKQAGFCPVENEQHVWRTHKHKAELPNWHRALKSWWELGTGRHIE